MKLTGLVIMVLLLVACASSAPQSAAVKATTNPDEVAACQLLGDVGTIADSGGLTGSFRDRRDTVKVLKNMTARLGGNVVLVTKSTEGQAYNCAAEPPQPS